ncbi:uncharacterized protein N7484_008079 [Penicillium longicatenatum]|uniref:uncharacterized protein n=1 Tax=Penicillium longicatenatum TaxID=1561947 RepID=UPI002546F684|nr:uncharacterized protein N7484_008079 [Penicillium longicatenatum]KAJ5640217.1 hypothetical protein N7484_008079 [Penicillium longicatenatum]
MDTVITYLPTGVSELLMENFIILEVVAMFSTGAYNAFEVGLSTFNHFTYYRGLYFWSLQVASWGILLHAVPAQLRYLEVAPNMNTCIPFLIGWYAMVTGQALVLYSRLHLVASDMRSLCWVLWMIIGNVFILHVPMTVFFLGVNLGNSRFTRGAHYFDRIQVVGFCMQDFIICGIYIYEALRALKPVIEARGREGRRVIKHLILVNLLVIGLNIFLLVAEFKMHWLEVSFKTVVYSIKLKLEFAILTRLRLLTRTTSCMCNNGPVNPRRSSDINVFDMAMARSRVSPDIEAPSLFFGVDPSSRRLSLRNSTYDFHQALRETASVENILSPVNSCYIPDLPTEKDFHPRIGSADTRSTVEMAFMESSK